MFLFLVSFNFNLICYIKVMLQISKEDIDNGLVEHKYNNTPSYNNQEEKFD